MADMTPVNSTGDLAAQLEQLKAQATQQYSLKNYGAAADFYSEAAEIQDSINGEMSPQNADLLYHYGRCLYHVAVQNSDVLGGKVASGEEPKRKKRRIEKSNGEGSQSGAVAGPSLIGDAIKSAEQKTAEEVVEAVVDEKDGVKTEAKGKDATSRPFFQITGDENWTDSEEEEEGDEPDGGAEAEEEEDDFATAYEILDMARVLLARKIESYTGDESKAAEIRQLQERLADTHDLQAEISLENERFHDAIKDTRDSLTLKLALYSPEDSLVAEAHFKLSLALEFASVTSTADAEDGSGSQVASVDESMRSEAAQEMEKAIASCKSRMATEAAKLPELPAEKAAEMQRNIADIKDMISDMETRLVDLRNPAASLSALQSGPAGAPGTDDPLRGVLGALLGENKVDQQKRIAQATENANDLSGLVKKGKKKQTEPQPMASYEGKGKRKAEEYTRESQPSSAPAGVNENGKKVKFEEPPAK